MTKYFIGLSLPPDLEQDIKFLSLSLDPNYAKSTPLHLTIKPPPLELNNAAAAALSGELSGLAVNFTHQPLRINSFGSFNPHNLHLKVTHSGWLDDLHEKILDITGLDKRDEFSPHITISRLSGEIPKGGLGQELLGKEFYPSSIDLFKHRVDTTSDPRRWESFQKIEFPRPIT